jgi:hypothetical protein
MRASAEGAARERFGIEVDPLQSISSRAFGAQVRSRLSLNSEVEESSSCSSSSSSSENPNVLQSG